MGVLRIKENVEELLEKDPYELFTLDEPHRVGRRMRPEFFGAAFIGVLIAFAVAFFTFWNVQQDAKDQADAPYAYFEVKAIDPDGRLVAGALVKEGDKILGVTDSFGEWRRFMRVKPGSTVTLSLSKKAANGNFSAMKNMAVPMTMPKGGDLELTGSVQLTRSGVKGLPAAKKGAAPNVESVAVEAEAGQGAEEAAPVAKQAAALDPGALDYSRIWVMTEGPVSPELGEVLAAVRRRVRELGVRVDPQGAWRLKLTEIQTGGEAKALVQVESVYDDGSGQPKRLFSYLRNFQDTSLQTARDVLWAATTHLERPYYVMKREGAWLVEDEAVKLLALSPGRHVYDVGGIGYQIVEGKDGALAGMLALEASNTEPCATGDRCQVTTGGVSKSSPVPGWTKMKMKVFGADDETVVYASGYEARKVQDKLYEYWGTPQGGANVTVIRSGKLVHRGRIQNGGAALPVVNLPMMPLSRR